MCITCILCLLPKIFHRISYDSCLKFSFLIIWVYASFRYEYGGDYINYEEMFIAAKYGKTMGQEYLFYFLMKLFPHYYIFIIFTSTILSFSFYFLIKKYAIPKYYWLCMLLLFLEASLLIFNFAAQRSALVVCVFIFALRFIEQRKIVQYTCLILLSSLFHISALILLPFYFITYLKIGPKLRVTIFISSIICLFIGNIVADYVMNSSLNLMEYSDYIFYKIHYYTERRTEHNISTLRSLIPYIIVCWLFAKYIQKETISVNRIIIFVNIVFIFLLLLQLDISGRISMYMWPFFMIGILILLQHMKNTFNRALLILVVLFQTSYGLINMYSAPYGISFHEYKTIFNAYILR
jgi:hypothetical protein